MFLCHTANCLVLFETDLFLEFCLNKDTLLFPQTIGILVLKKLTFHTLTEPLNSIS